MKDIQVRTMITEDWLSVKSIYENGIKTGIATFETAAPSWEQWNDSHLKIGRLVAVVDNKIAGWIALSPVSSRCVYGGVAEISVYVHEDYRKKGIGKKLLKDAISESEQNDIWTLQAGVFRENIGSIELHKKIGFRVIGFRERIGKIKGAWKDNVILERRSEVVGI
jgi:phosphinothricin acetyltransferase